MASSEYSSYDAFKKENRIKVNHYLNIILFFFVITGPAIALGIRTGMFPNVDYITCFGISIFILVLSFVHLYLRKSLPESVATSVFALIALNILLVYMTCAHVSIYLTWFLVPLLSLLFCDRKIYYFASASNYIFMIIAAWITAPFYA
ncbi:MAG: hypothetical protein J5966_02685, partial [Lachnospiraceae bacterium]|nr:hypothetical protein [Lachnospiraceae bacterium]